MKKSVGRPREFDPQDFLDTALSCFWRNGYQATSLSDLMRASGLASASIYQLYPDKHAIFLAALRQYMDTGLARLSQRAADMPPDDALRKTLDFFARVSAGPDGEKGCFSIAAANEMLPGDEEVRNQIEYMFNGIIVRLTHILRQGQQTGVFRTDYEPEVMAESIFMMLEGMRVYGKIQPDIATLRKANDFILHSVIATADERHHSQGRR
ncbi:TetR/AcrR family transcriptional regulator [Musicola paradisiaca]|uniref:Transcriptional regulator, TetR family n=1 Tax=Musicola paradisiaca (strain Ech703) TaxID=579405 RepID=C6C9W1_MUSP7|nr:TetR/AcrR family transcriptional regulator [Musicola paradisiaca]ACS86383.1 transcriptional regulator, TetR family [Musicola paradisiaca Ech703]